MKFLLIFFSFLCMSSITVFGQEKDVNDFGKKLARTILEKDSNAFKDCILPKRAILENFHQELAPSLEKEEVRGYLEEIDTMYEQMSALFAFNFNSLCFKVETFNLDLSEVHFQIYESQKDLLDTSILSVHGTIDSDKFPHFIFYVTKYRDELYLAIPILTISEKNSLEERDAFRDGELSSNENGDLVCEGSFDLNNKESTPSAILKCVLNSPLTIGVVESSSALEESSIEYIRGEWEHNYYVNHSKDYAGSVSFRYEFRISEGVINYRYYDYAHSGDDSEFNSVGILPHEFDSSLAKVFTKDQFGEILNDIKLNLFFAVRKTKEYVDKCLE